MQPARIKLHAKEHTNNPVQRPNFRGQGAKKLRDRVRHSSGSKNGSSRNDTTPKSVSCQGLRRLSKCGRVLEVASLVIGRIHSQGSQSQGQALRS
jgi:hypothetical protein